MSTLAITGRRRRGSVTTCLLLFVALVLAACGGSASSGGSDRADQRLRFGLSAEPVALKTGVWQGSATNFLMTLVHRGLMIPTVDGIQPALAESVDTPDPTTYVFTLREGLTFHDGSPLTAENVKSSLEYYAKPDTGANIVAGLKDIASIEVQDERTVTITLAQPNAAFLEYLAVPTAAIVPDSSLNADTANQVGAGPFAWGELTQGVGLTLEPFAGYYEADKVALDGIDVAFYPDGDARANALLSGDVDMIDYVTWENFSRIEDADNLTLSAEPGPFQYVQFNVNDGPFADPLVRQAVAYAINRDNALQAAFQSNGKILNGVVMPQDTPFEDLGQDLWEHDPERAKELLAEAGYPDGFSATMLATSQYTFLQDTALSVQQDLKEIGIDVTLDAPDWSGRLEKGAAGDYDIAVSGEVGMISDPSYLLAFVQPPNNFNRSFDYDNQEIVAALVESLRATDEAQRVAAVEKALEIFGQDVPFASINVRDQAWAFTSDLKGFENLSGFKTFWSSYSLATASFEG